SLFVHLRSRKLNPRRREAGRSHSGTMGWPVPSICPTLVLLRARSTATIAPKNVIVVVCNGLHLGFLGAYGNGWIDTPHLDRLAAEGVVFDHHFPENLTTLPT